MRVLFRVILFSFFLAPAGAHAMDFIEAAARLDGRWAGDDFLLRVDSHRAQASIDAERPFHWQRFLVRDVSDDKVVFAIGPEIFEAKLQEEGLVLTGTSFVGERTLRKQDLSADP